MTDKDAFMISSTGMTEGDIREEYMESMTARMVGLEMVVAGLMSDCQELLAMAGDKERVREQVRQQMNIAKFILFEMLEAKRDAETMLVNSDGKEIA